MSILGQFIGETINLAKETLTSASRNVLNAVYPKEFEAHFISLELTDENDNIEEYFTFPINPSSINKVEPRTKSIERTFGKVIINKSDQFTPQDITIKGNFGRDFKIVIRHKGEMTLNSLIGLTKMFTEEEFSPIIKSGYGSFKILQSICDRADSSVNQTPRKLYLHNYFMGESYLVEVIDFAADQSLSMNMMWGYTLRLKVISPINQDFMKKLKRSTSNTAQKTMNKSLGNVRKLTSSILS